MSTPQKAPRFNINSRHENLRKGKTTQRRTNANMNMIFSGKDEYDIIIPSMKSHNYGPSINETYTFTPTYFSNLTAKKCNAIKEYIEKREAAMGKPIEGIRKSTANGGERISCDKAIVYIKQLLKGMEGGARKTRKRMTRKRRV
jgi:hypothetical protein